ALRRPDRSPRSPLCLVICNREAQSGECCGVPLILAGIDEAGYGPLLGPLGVGMTACRIEDCSVADLAAGLGDALKSAVCKNAADRRGRIAVDDSKKLKGPNDRTTRHAVAELERAVLGFLVCEAVRVHATPVAAMVGGADDTAFDAG